MIKANGIMVGNWVNVVGRGINEDVTIEEINPDISKLVGRISPTSTRRYDLKKVDVNPIMLDERWLTKLGYEYEHNSGPDQYCKSTILSSKYSKGHVVLIVFPHHTDRFWIGCNKKRSEEMDELFYMAVHQLQNIFLLTSIEQTKIEKCHRND